MMNNQEQHHSLSELQELIGETIRNNLGRQLWVKAEVAEIKINYSGHCYLELIEKGTASDEITAKVRAIIWSKQARFLLPYFHSTTGSNLGEGMKILVKTGIEYHKLYGLSLIVFDIDPEYTLGELAAKRLLVIKRLEEEGVIAMNRELVFPLFPKRIAVVSSESAAGYSDFRDQLINNSPGYRFEITLFSAVMQGRDTSGSVINALDSIFADIDSYDIVAIVRGGGSQSDLSWFDSYEIAYLITQFPVPVLTGIGHEKDISVADMVAFENLKTPTAVADYIISCTSDTEALLNNTARRISELSSVTINEMGMRIDREAGKLESFSEIFLSRHRHRLTNIAIKIPSTARIIIIDHQNRLVLFSRDIKNSGSRLFASIGERLTTLGTKLSALPKKSITLQREYLAGMERSVKSLSPESVLKRGYSITRIRGKAIKDSSEVQKGDIIVTTIQSGSFDSEVFDINQ